MPLTSPICEHGLHARCPHRAHDGNVNVLQVRRRARALVSLCDCDCHADCPLTGPAAVLRDVWLERCTCVGAARVQELSTRGKERGLEIAASLQQARQEGHPNAAEIQQRIRAVYESHGERPPPTTALANMLSAGTARHGTRTLRLLWLAARAIARSVRWSWQPPSGVSQPARGSVDQAVDQMLDQKVDHNLSAAAQRLPGRRNPRRCRRIAHGSSGSRPWPATPPARRRGSRLGAPSQPGALCS